MQSEQLTLFAVITNGHRLITTLFLDNLKLLTESVATF